jgi:hypothetical protein
VNFFGHAVVATWRSREPGFVLGAMLPDFATMIGARVPRVRADDLERGVAYHHATDRVFHDSRVFRELQADARRALRDAGLPRPAALAVGHIGVEILLDAALAGEPFGVAGYLAALDAGAPEGLGPHIDWGDGEAAVRYERLRAALVARGVNAAMGGAQAAALRVARALASRPRFQLDADGERIVHVWAERTMPAITGAADALVIELLEGLPGAVRPTRQNTV